MNFLEETEDETPDWLSPLTIVLAVGLLVFLAIGLDWNI